MAIKKGKTIWRMWAKAIGEKSSSCSAESDRVAIVRTLIFLTYLLTNCFIVAGVIRHWDGPVQEPSHRPSCGPPTHDRIVE